MKPSTFPYPSLWRKQFEEKADKQEAERLRLLTAVSEVLQELSAKYSWEKAYIIGSVTQPGRYGPHSDADIALKGLDKFQLYAFIGDISMQLKRDVDVIRLEETPFAETIIKKGIPWIPKVS